MKFSIQREAFLKPLQQVIGVVERRQTLPVLGNVLLNANKKTVKLTATDLEVELQAQVAVPVTETGDITLPARKLLDIPHQAAPCRRVEPDGFTSAFHSVEHVPRTATLAIPEADSTVGEAFHEGVANGSCYPTPSIPCDARDPHLLHEES